MRWVKPALWTALPWAAGVLVMVLSRGGSPSASDVLVLAVTTVLVVAGGVLLDRWPLPGLALLLVTLPLGSELSIGVLPFTQFVVVAFGLYRIAAVAAPRTAWIALAGAAGVQIVFLLYTPLISYYVLVLVSVIAWLLGRAVRQARDHTADRVTWTTAQAVTDERLRISRELHDTVAHSIGVIAFQAGAARRVIETRPAEAAQALGEIETAGRDVLAGLRRMLIALRDGDTAPAAGLADLRRLTTAGVSVEFRELGGRRALPPEVDAAAYRIIQEAVTNVARHAATGSCVVTIDYREDGLAVEIVDAGRGARGQLVPGFGLAGMRERAALLDGEFTAGPAPEGGFRVAARLPVEAR
ncbi:sensor histidine kinase [Herbidospora mongoliensis]|uniref:sensor histidine kinase n=1 Tax=Herbidospora mongoliensis TaxID=688067 RepID=UPI000830CF5F|nr:sensor histidine kinase [Herbidospora mongoliensis]